MYIRMLDYVEYIHAGLCWMYVHMNDHIECILTCWIMLNVYPDGLFWMYIHIPGYVKCIYTYRHSGLCWMFIHMKDCAEYYIHMLDYIECISIHIRAMMNVYTHTHTYMLHYIECISNSWILLNVHARRMWMHIHILDYNYNYGWFALNCRWLVLWLNW